jgi:hypothetical protein
MKIPSGECSPLQEPGIPSQGPGIRSQGPGIRSQEALIPSVDPCIGFLNSVDLSGTTDT